MLVALIAAAAGFFGVRLIADLASEGAGRAGRHVILVRAGRDALPDAGVVITGLTAANPQGPARPSTATTLAGMSSDAATQTRAKAEEAAAALARATGVLHHDVAMIMGSGWVPAAERLGTATADIDVSTLPGFSAPVVAGHAGRIRSIPIGDKRALVLLGRTHLYEGRGVGAVVHGVRTAVAAGATLIVLTNAAGGLRQGMTPGDPVLISDHLNLTATSPIVGAKFVDLTDLYSPRLRALAERDRPEPDRGCVRPAPRPAFRDARRDPDAPHAGRRPGRHVDRAGGDRRPRGRGGGVRAVAGDQPGGRHDGRAAGPRGGAGNRPGGGRRHGRPARRAWSPAHDRLPAPG